MFSTLASILFLLLIQVHNSSNSPIEFYKNNLFSSTINDQQNNDVKPERPEISETVSKILRLMHSLSNKNILIPTNEENNYDLDLIKRDNLRNFDSKERSALNLKLIIENDKLNEKLKKLNKINEKLKNELNQKIQTDEDKDDNLFEKIKEFNKKEDDQSSYFNRHKDNKEQSKFIDPIRSKNDEVTNPIYLKLLSKLNEQIEQRRESSKIINGQQIDNMDLKDELKEDLKDELNHLKEQKNLYDMVENEEEDNVGEEEHFHNYNISLLSDVELNRTLTDIQYLLNNNLSKQEMETKFSSKGRNNRNKIAQRMEYFEKLYRNIHNLSLPQNQKRGEGPQLSVVSPLDILRDKLVLEIARRKIEQSKSQMKENEDYLKKIG